MYYEIYSVPNDELDGTEEYLDEKNTLPLANKRYEELLSEGYSNLWLIKCSDSEGYEKVLRS